MKGIDLKLKRIGRRITVKDMAAAMGCAPSYVSLIERRDVVAESQLTRYLGALSTFEKAA